MAADIPRTTADDATDALAALDAAEREMKNLRAHLNRLIVDGPNVSTAYAARHSARIVAGSVSEAKGITGSAVRRSELHDRQLRQLAAS